MGKDTAKLREVKKQVAGVIEAMEGAEGKEVEEASGEVMVISTENEAGTKLLSLGGVAALLRFSLP